MLVAYSCRKSKKTFKSLISDNILQIISSLKNHIIGASLRALETKKGSSLFHLWCSVFTAERRYQRKSKQSKWKIGAKCSNFLQSLCSSPEANGAPSCKGEAGKWVFQSVIEKDYSAIFGTRWWPC